MTLNWSFLTSLVDTPPHNLEIAGIETPTIGDTAVHTAPLPPPPVLRNDPQLFGRKIVGAQFFNSYCNVMVKVIQLYAAMEIKFSNFRRIS